MNANERAWALTAALIGVHQGEELLLPMAEWLDRVGSSGWAGLDAHMRSSPLAGRDPWARAGAVAAQGAALCVLYLATRRSGRATRAATGGLPGALLVLRSIRATRSR